MLDLPGVIQVESAQPVRVVAAPVPATVADPVLRYFLLGGAIGLANRESYRRARIGMAAWLGAPLQLARLLGRTGRRRELHALERWWARGVTRHLAIDLRIRGLEHIDPAMSYIVTPLHEGFADALALLQVPLQLRFVARDELFDWRYFGALLRDTGHLKINPEDGAASYRALRRQAPPILASGESLVLFPQGSILGIEIDFRTGPFALARALGRPILPIAITGGHRVREHPFSPRLRYGQRMDLQILPPVPADVLRATDVDHVRREVQRRLKTEALAEAMAPPRRFIPSRDGYWDGYAFEIDPAFPDVADEIDRHRTGVRREQVSSPHLTSSCETTGLGSPAAPCETELGARHASMSG